MALITWSNPGAGNFGDAANWSTGTVPGPGDTAILPSLAAAYTVSFTGSRTVASVQTAAGATLTIRSGILGVTAGTTNAGVISVSDGASLELAGAVANSGNIRMGGASRTTTLFIGGSGVTLSGAGGLALTDNPNNLIQGATVGVTLTNIGNTIAGAGTIDGMTLVNQAGGVIQAFGANNPLVLGSGLTVANHYLLEALGKGSVLRIESTVDNAGGGEIVANTGTAVSLFNATILGGAIYSDGTGVINTVSDPSNTSSLLDGEASALTIAGALTVTNGTALTIDGAIVNKKVITVAGVANSTQLIIGSPNATLSGTGTLTLSGPNSAIEAAGPTAVLTNAGNTIDGGGIVGVIVNNLKSGVVDANGASPLILGPFGEVNLNTGTMESTGGTLVIEDTTVNSAGGGMFISTAGTVEMIASDLEGGTFVTSGTGAIEAMGAGNTLDGVASPVVNKGVLTIYNNSALTIDGAIDNTKTILVDSISAKSSLIVGPTDTVLDGGGTVSLSGPSAQITGQTASDVLTLANGAISGAGIVNRLVLDVGAKGVIDATGAFTVDTAGVAIGNAGLLETTGSGGLSIVDTTVNNAGGVILSAGGKVNLQKSDIVGGTLSTSGSGVIVANGAGDALDGAAGHALTIAGLLSVATGASLTITGSIIDKDKVTVGGASGDLIVGSGGATLSGGGLIILGGKALDQIGAATPASLANLGDTISGGGAVGNANLTLMNGASGLIDGAASTSLTLDTGANVIVNAGGIETTAVGGLVIQSAVKNTGVLTAARGTLTVDDAVTGSGHAAIAGGTLDFAASFNQDVVFAAGSTGALQLADSQAYSATISGFSTTGMTSLDLADIGYVAGTTRATFDGTATGGVLTVTDGTHIAKIHLAGDFLASVWTLSAAPGGGTKVVDPAHPAPVTPATHPFAQSMAALPSVQAAASPGADVWRAAPAALALMKPQIA